MEMQIETKQWKVVTSEKGQKNIGGDFVVKCGKNTVATKGFNDGYGDLKISFPAIILAKIEEIDEEIRQVIIKNFE